MSSPSLALAALDVPVLWLLVVHHPGYRSHIENPALAPAECFGTRTAEENFLSLQLALVAA